MSGADPNRGVPPYFRLLNIWISLFQENMSLDPMFSMSTMIDGCVEAQQSRAHSPTSTTAVAPVVRRAPGDAGDEASRRHAAVDYSRPDAKPGASKKCHLK